MPGLNIDFEGSVQSKPAEASTQEADVTNPVQQEDVTHLDGGGTDDVTGKDGNSNNESNNQQVEGQEQQDSSTGDLEPGTELEFDGAVYTVAENGDIVDADGKVFKEAKDVKAWLDGSNVEESTEEDFDINSVMDAIGVDVLDENGNAIEFENSPAGIKGYVDAVLNVKSTELQQGAVNKLFADNPMLKEFIDYVQLTGSPRGFGDIPDRSGIKVDPNNEQQQEAIIRMAASEFGNASLNDNYIKYLKSSGALYDEAQAQLNALVKKDKEYRDELSKRAEAARAQEEQDVENYWQGVSEAIANRVIGGYQIPESFVKEINGQKITFTPDDFYTYLSRATETDEQGNTMTGYQRDLNNLSDKDLLDRELLDAWLMFTGGSYKDLVDMAVKENEVRRLIVKSKQQKSNRTVKITKANKSKGSIEDIIF